MQVLNHGLFYIVRNFILSIVMTSSNLVLFNNGPQSLGVTVQRNEIKKEGLIDHGFRHVLESLNVFLMDEGAAVCIPVLTPSHVLSC